MSAATASVKNLTLAVAGCKLWMLFNEAFMSIPSLKLLLHL